MANCYKSLIKKLFIVAVFAAPLLLTAGEAEIQAANELLEVIQFEKVMDNSINASIQALKEMSPGIGNNDIKLKQFFEKHMGAKTLRNDMIDMYSEIFSAKELKDIAAFYKTKTGQKALEKIPEVMQRSMQLAQTRVMQNVAELQEIMAQGQETSK